jgi:hypothetical protein
MTRVLLSVAILVLAAALLVVARVSRYQYFSVIGPSWSTRAATEAEVRRVDRWTGKPQVWVCQDIDTGQVANVPRPPTAPDAGSAPVGDLDAAVRTGAYALALKRWRTTYPNVDPETLRVTKPQCGWEGAD